MNSENNVDSIQSAATNATCAIIDPMDSSVISALTELDQKIQTKLENMNLTTAQTMQVLTIIHDTVRPEISKLTAICNGMNLQQQEFVSDMTGWKMDTDGKMIMLSDTELSHYHEVSSNISQVSYYTGQNTADIHKVEAAVIEIKENYLPKLIDVINSNRQMTEYVRDKQIELIHYYDSQMYWLNHQHEKLGWKLWYQLSGRCIIGDKGWVFPPLREYATCDNVPVALRVRWWFSDRFHSIRTKLAHLFGKEEHTDEHVE